VRVRVRLSVPVPVPMRVRERVRVRLQVPVPVRACVVRVCMRASMQACPCSQLVTMRVPASAAPDVARQPLLARVKGKVVLELHLSRGATSPVAHVATARVSKMLSIPDGLHPAVETAPFQAIPVGRWMGDGPAPSSAAFNSTPELHFMQTPSCSCSHPCSPLGGFLALQLHPACRRAGSCTCEGAHTHTHGQQQQQPRQAMAAAAAAAAAEAAAAAAAACLSV